MKILDAIANRYSCRRYLARPVEKEKIERIIIAADLAPSARGLRDTHFVMVTEESKKQGLAVAANNQAFVRDAGLVVVACSSSEHIMRCGQPSSPVNAAIALEHMALQSVEEGLASCWIGSFYPEQVKEVLKIPSETQVLYMMTIGYSLDNSPIRKLKVDSSPRFFSNYWGFK
jgi:nitroreductase